MVRFVGARTVKDLCIIVSVGLALLALPFFPAAISIFGTYMLWRKKAIYKEILAQEENDDADQDVD